MLAIHLIIAYALRSNAFPIILRENACKPTFCFAFRKSTKKKALPPPNQITESEEKYLR